MNPSQVCNRFSIDWVHGLIFHCLYIDKDTGFLWGLIFHHHNLKEDLKAKSLTLCIHNQKLQASSEIRSLFSRSVDFWREDCDHWCYYQSIIYHSQALASGTVGLMWGLFLLTVQVPSPLKNVLWIPNYRLGLLPVLTLYNPTPGG